MSTPPHRLAYRPTVMGTRGCVAAAHPLAAMAGIQLLLQGGSAVDAACATSFALNVVEPYMSAVGGVAALLLSRRGALETLISAGQVPAAVDPARLTAADLKGGPASIGVPGLPAAILALHDRYGTLPRERVFAPAIRLAEEGFPLTWRNCEFFAKGREQLAYSAEAEATFLPGGRVPPPGTVLVQKELGGTLRQLAEGGAEALYRGPLARAIARAVRERGGVLAEADLAGYAPAWGTPTGCRFRDHDVYVTTYSFQMLQTLQILEGFDLRGFGHNSADYLHHVIEAVKLASADRVAWGPRPDLPLAGLLSPGYAAERRRLIDPARAGVSGGERWSAETLPGQILPGHPADFMKEHTTHFAAADGDGTVVTVTQTLGSPFGSGVMVPGTGMLLNNMLFWTDLDPASPAVLRPGARLQTRMSPTQVFRDGGFLLSIGTPGSFGILQTTPQMILNVLEFDMLMQEAIEAPRVRVYRDRLVDVEGRVPPETREALAARGHQVNVIDDWSWVVGGGQGIRRDPESGALQGGADPRRDGYALAI
ncbi:MAG: gamma-glutamyltransferase family protein [Candidatus Rokubacteria bacterium]|nr:gamma-glutamyltransferase family protein [Candidatus Rokubacteria bacterium]